jgi:hypothetical protein
MTTLLDLMPRQSFLTARPEDLPQLNASCPPRTKKADVAEHPKAFDHVGLLFNKPPERLGLFFIWSSG